MPGHEIVGTVAAAAEDAPLELGQRVAVGWQRSACFRCALCLQGQAQLCAERLATCVDHPGGFADRVRVDARFVFPVPAGLDSAQTAPLLCAGVTVFAPLRRWGMRAGAKVGVVGIGGLGHLALKILKAMGCESVAFTASPDKGADALRLGASEVASSKRPAEIRRYRNGLDLVLCTAPARLDWISYLDTLKPNGVLCLVGAPSGLLQIPAAQLLTQQRILCGSDVGSPDDLRQLLALAAEHRLGADIEALPMAEVNTAIERLRENRVRYRMVLTGGQTP